MKKNVLMIVMIMLFASSAFSQINVYAEGAISTKENVKARLGIGAMYLHPITDAFHLGANMAYRQSLTSDYYAAQIPIMAVARYYVMGDATGFYPQVSLGLVNSFSRIKVFNNTIKSSSSNFGFNVGAGYRLDNNLDFSLLYENIVFENASASAFLIRVGFNF
ncbi:MAG: outer membrane beta-barrel protein [Bacteroidales bacterium]|nr:outer membrane beta-barrel protein [Bacteroidales bacterium]